MTDLTHTCANDDGKRDAGMAVGACVACDLETVRHVLFRSADGHSALDRIVARLGELETDKPDLEACAELIVKLDENGPGRGNRERVKLLADWQRVRKPQ